TMRTSAHSLHSLPPRTDSANLPVIVASPQQSDANRLRLLVVAGPGHTHSLLTSATTRSPGIVANTDVAPTLLGWMDVAAPSSMVGHPIRSDLSSDPESRLVWLDHKLRVNARSVIPLFVGLGTLAAIVVF